MEEQVKIILDRERAKLKEEQENLRNEIMNMIDKYLNTSEEELKNNYIEFKEKMLNKFILFNSFNSPGEIFRDRYQKEKKEINETIKKNRDEILAVKRGEVIPYEVEQKRLFEKMTPDDRVKYVDDQIKKLGLSDEDIEKKLEDNKLSIVSRDNVELREAIENVRTMTEIEQAKAKNVRKGLFSVFKAYGSRMALLPISISLLAPIMTMYGAVPADPQILLSAAGVGLALGTTLDGILIRSLIKDNPNSVKMLKDAGIYDEVVNQVSEHDKNEGRKR